MPQNDTASQLILTWDISDESYTHTIEPHQIIIIGRHSACNISVNDSAMSRRHAEISHDGTHFQVKNLSKVNAVHVLYQDDAQHLDHEQTAILPDAAIMQIGSTRFILQLDTKSIDMTFRIKCATCGKLSESDRTDCPWCGANLAYGESVFIEIE